MAVGASGRPSKEGDGGGGDRDNRLDTPDSPTAAAVEGRASEASKRAARRAKAAHNLDKGARDESVLPMRSKSKRASSSDISSGTLEAPNKNSSTLTSWSSSLSSANSRLTDSHVSKPLNSAANCAASP